MISSNHYLWPVIWLLNFGTLNHLSEATEGVEASPLSTYELLTNSNPSVPSEDIFEMAIQGWSKLQDTLSYDVITIIDFTLPSTEKRMWIIDPLNGEVLLHSLVAHGRNSGDLMAYRFSNRAESYQSSLGFYRTGETYQGKHGYSLRLDGLEQGINDQARNRAIVIHGAEYANESFVKSAGRLGRSLGCPALPTDLTDEAINLIKEGSLLFIYGNDPEYLHTSEILEAPNFTANL
jgi:hypothetical protein